MSIVRRGEERESTRGMRGSARGANASLDAHVAARPSSDVLHVSRECATDAQQSIWRTGTIGRFLAHGQTARRVYRISWRTCECIVRYRSCSTGGSSYQRDFQDAEVYLLRYQQCMTRSMTLIKIYFVNTIKAMGQEVSRKLADRVSVFGPKP